MRWAPAPCCSLPHRWQTIANAGSLADLVADIAAGQVETLVVVDSNPAYTAPGSLDFGEALQKVRSSLHLGLQRDETGELCEWQLPLTHALESWSDARAVDGTATIIQPVITPFYDVRTVHQIVAMLLGSDRSGGRRRSSARPGRPSFGGDFEAGWRQALHDGFVKDTAVRASDTSIGRRRRCAPPFADDGLDIVFRPDPTIWDGQFANVGWLQELPKPLTTLTWGNVVAHQPSAGEADRRLRTAIMSRSRSAIAAWSGRHGSCRARPTTRSRFILATVASGPDASATALAMTLTTSGPPISRGSTKGSLHKVGSRRDLGGHAAASSHGWL